MGIRDIVQKAALSAEAMQIREGWQDEPPTPKQIDTVTNAANRLSVTGEVETFLAESPTKGEVGRLIQELFDRENLLKRNRLFR